MHHPVLSIFVLVSGKPETGKSILAQQLTSEGTLWLPAVVCDLQRNGIRTTMTAQSTPPAARPGKEAVDLFYDTIAFLLARGVSLIAELSLRRGLDEARVAALLPRCRVWNVHCVVDSAVARQRFLDRQAVRGGVDPANPIATSMRDGTFDWLVFAPLDLPLPRLLVDTSVGYAPTLVEILAFCQGQIQQIQDSD